MEKTESGMRGGSLSNQAYQNLKCEKGELDEIREQSGVPAYKQQEISPYQKYTHCGPDLLGEARSGNECISGVRAVE